MTAWTDDITKTMTDMRLILNKLADGRLKIKKMLATNPDNLDTLRLVVFVQRFRELVLGGLLGAFANLDGFYGL